MESAVVERTSPARLAIQCVNPSIWNFNSLSVETEKLKEWKCLMGFVEGKKVYELELGNLADPSEDRNAGSKTCSTD